MGKYYAVKVGLVPGIYTDWDKCKKLVNGYPGAQYKSFRSYEDAERYMKGEEIKSEKQPKQEKYLPQSNTKSACCGLPCVTLYSDGAAKGNPDGPGGYGAIISFVDTSGNEHIREFSQGYIKTTNNRMELMGAIVAFENLTTPCSVTIYSDSKYLVDAINKKWLDNWIKNNWHKSDGERVKNVDLWIRLLNAMKKHSVEFRWVKGHNGHIQNEQCDKLATTAAASNNLIDDEVVVDEAWFTNQHQSQQPVLPFLS